MNRYLKNPSQFSDIPQPATYGTPPVAHTQMSPACGASQINFVEHPKEFWNSNGQGMAYSKGVMYGSAVQGTEQSIREFFIKFDHLIISMFREAMENKRIDSTKHNAVFDLLKTTSAILCRVVEDNDLTFDTSEMSAMLHGFISSYATTHSIK